MPTNIKSTANTSTKYIQNSPGPLAPIALGRTYCIYIYKAAIPTSAEASTGFKQTSAGHWLVERGEGIG